MNSLPSRTPPGRRLRELPTDDRPRERLLRLGVEALSDTELLALLLGSGTRGFSALDVASAHLGREGGLDGLSRRDPGYLTRLDGIGPARASLLAAAVELGRRVCQVRSPRSPLLTSSDSVRRHLLARASGWNEERVGGLLLDTRHRLLFDREIVRGSLDSAAVTPRDVLRRCLLDDAAALILYHNHPSGDPTPSRDDVSFTRMLGRACRVVGVRLLDHVIVGSEGCVSLASRGLMGESP